MPLSRFLKEYPYPAKPGYRLLYSTKKTSVALLEEAVLDRAKKGKLTEEEAKTLRDLGMLATSREEEREEMRAWVDEFNRKKTRSEAIPLTAVKRVYVASLGDNLFSQQVRDQLIRGLQASGRFIVTEDPEAADAALKGLAKQEATRVDRSSGEEVQVGEVTLQLVNAAGKVLWATAPRKSGEKYQGSAAAIADQVVKGLLKKQRRATSDE